MIVITYLIPMFESPNLSGLSLDTSQLALASFQKSQALTSSLDSLKFSNSDSIFQGSSSSQPIE